MCLNSIHLVQVCVCVRAGTPVSTQKACQGFPLLSFLPLTPVNNRTNTSCLLLALFQHADLSWRNEGLTWEEMEEWKVWNECQMKSFASNSREKETFQVENITILENVLWPRKYIDYFSFSLFFVEHNFPSTWRYRNFHTWVNKLYHLEVSYEYLTRYFHHSYSKIHGGSTQSWKASAPILREPGLPAPAMLLLNFSWPAKSFFPEIQIGQRSGNPL